MKRVKKPVVRAKSFKKPSKSNLKISEKKIPLKKKVVSARKIFTSSKSRRPSIKTANRVNLSLAQQEVSQAKFFNTSENYHAPTQQYYTPPMPADLPWKYDEDKLVIQVRDPWWVYSYWEVKDETLHQVRQKHHDRFDGARSVLRVYDVSLIHFNGKNAHRFFDIDVHLDSKSWYIDVGEAGKSWVVELGFILRDGSFVMLIRSNVVTTPIDGPSWITDEEWMIPDERFARLYGMGFGMAGFGGSSPTTRAMVEQIKTGRLKLFPISSPGLFSISSPRKGFISRERRKGFWLLVNTELIVYGATEPDAKVKVCGKPIKLNSDGTFSLRFALPDGQQVIPVEAHSSDNEDSRSVTPIVTRETH